MIESDQAPVVRIVDAILYNAVCAGSSDIHLEPSNDQMRVRFRIDGVLRDQKSLESALHVQILSRLKVLAHLDISQKRIPQDGKFRLILNTREIDLRVSTFPSLYGEHMVIRILDRGKQALDPNQLGMDEDVRDGFMRLMQKSSGFFLVSGPTGSGKTTTLYAALSRLNKSDCHIITLEDPVEYHVAGITQGQIHPASGFTFDKGIRAILRQDPDIVMVGEIRDVETAHIAIEAALTGHLVLSTIHTNDASSVIMRLMDMGIEPFLINASLSGVMAQRLVRMICVHCKSQKKPTAEQHIMLRAFELDLDAIYHGSGCDNCAYKGYTGRTGIFELLEMTYPLRSLVVQDPSFDKIFTQACKSGMQTIKEAGKKKVVSGIITIDELARALA